MVLKSTDYVFKMRTIRTDNQQKFEGFDLSLVEAEATQFFIANFVQNDEMTMSRI